MIVRERIAHVPAATGSAAPYPGVLDDAGPQAAADHRLPRHDRSGAGCPEGPSEAQFRPGRRRVWVESLRPRLRRQGAGRQRLIPVIEHEAQSPVLAGGRWTRHAQRGPGDVRPHLPAIVVGATGVPVGAGRATRNVKPVGPRADRPIASPGGVPHAVAPACTAPVIRLIWFLYPEAHPAEKPIVVVAESAPAPHASVHVDGEPVVLRQVRSGRGGRVIPDEIVHDVRPQGQPLSIVAHAYVDIVPARGQMVGSQLGDAEPEDGGLRPCFGNTDVRSIDSAPNRRRLRQSAWRAGHRSDHDERGRYTHEGETAREPAHAGPPLRVPDRPALACCGQGPREMVAPSPWKRLSWHVRRHSDALSGLTYLPIQYTQVGSRQ